MMAHTFDPITWINAFNPSIERWRQEYKTERDRVSAIKLEDSERQIGPIQSEDA